jgi:hypothetical protein
VFTVDGFCKICVVLGGDVKREIHLWPKDDDFKALLYL